MQGEFVGFAFEDAPASSFGVVEKCLVAHPVPSDIEEVLEADPVDLQFQHEGRITGLRVAESEWFDGDLLVPHAQRGPHCLAKPGQCRRHVRFSRGVGAEDARNRDKGGAELRELPHLRPVVDRDHRQLSGGEYRAEVLHFEPNEHRAPRCNWMGFFVETVPNLVLVYVYSVSSQFSCPSLLPPHASEKGNGTASSGRCFEVVARWRAVRCADRRSHRIVAVAAIHRRHGGRPHAPRADR